MDGVWHVALWLFTPAEMSGQQEHMGRCMKPGRPLGLPGPPTQSTESSVARDLLLAAFHRHGREHANINIALGNPETLAIDGHILHPRFECVLVDSVDD